VDEFTPDQLRAVGFDGFVRLRTLRPEDVPMGGGVSVVVRTADHAPTFLPSSGAGWFKGRDPSVAIETLTDSWVENCPVLYIGKATSLRRRLREYSRFGAGHKVGRWGGRYIWQLAESDELLVAWRPTEKLPRGVEKDMLRRFAARYGRRPFANLTG